MSVFLISATLIKTASAALRVWTVAAATVLLTLFGATSANAGFCGQYSCTLTFTESAFSSPGNFGTVSLNLSGNTVAIDVHLATGYTIIHTGSANGHYAAIGFADNLGGGLSFSNISDARYSGVQSDATNDLKFDGFGYGNDAVGKATIQNGTGVNELTFKVSKSSLTDVRQLLQLFSPAGGNGPAVFAVDAGFGRTTGYIAVARVPEPGSLLLLGTGLLALGILRRRKMI